MTLDPRCLQARLAALGHNPGPIDGIPGRRTSAALAAAHAEYGPDLVHASGLHRIHLHWTAGAYGVIDMERKAYNGLVNQDGERHAGRWSFEDQAHYQAGVRGASHTLNANSGAIGLSCDAMAGAVERPFNPGAAPLTWAQIDALAQWVAELSERYWIPITRYSVLTHAEVQPTLGIRQRFKWDITWLPDMARPGDPIEVGDRIRALALDYVGRVDVRCAA